MDDIEDPTLLNVLNDDKLKWIYVGGKGGVGKTTTSCALAVRMARHRKNEKILLISTDPAHNTSDTFDQKFNAKPQQVNDVENLYCMEIDASGKMVDEEDDSKDPIFGLTQKGLSKILNNLPGIDEALAYAEVMRQIKSMEYDRIIFDTAPTGHTLRFLDFPNTLQKGLDKLLELKSMVGPMMDMMIPMMGEKAEDFRKMSATLDNLKPLVEEIRQEFQNPERTTFICVCIAEFLSLYETERLIQKLMDLNIDSRNIVVNQLISGFGDDAQSAALTCSRKAVQQAKYLQKYKQLYLENEFTLIKMPLLHTEVRGLEKLQSFSEGLANNGEMMVDGKLIEGKDLEHPILDNDKLKWIFCGGKGGVGKTTTSCSLATQLAKRRKSVLLISTDPAHNTSDAFNQKFSREPTQVNGFNNLWCMEVQPDLGMDGLPDSILEKLDGGNMFSMLKNFLGDILNSFPGIDEAMAYYEIWRLVESHESQFDCVVFDTAPTGHTLRLLNFPNFLEESLKKLSGIKHKISGVASMVGTMMGGTRDGVDLNSLIDKIDEYLPVVQKIKREFKDVEKTTFVCVCIAEFLSLYETERLIQELVRMEIDTQCIVVNQLLTSLDDGQIQALFKQRQKLQEKYLDKIDALYGDDFHLVQMPLLAEEVRKVERLTEFSEYLVKPYQTKTDGDFK